MRRRLVPQPSTRAVPHEVVRPEDVKWGPASPKLLPGAQFAVLLGDPSKPGAPYVFRTRLPDGYSVAPHWHPMDENVTVIRGVSSKWDLAKSSTSMRCEICPLDLTRCCHVVYFTITHQG